MGSKGLPRSRILLNLALSSCEKGAASGYECWRMVLTLLSLLISSALPNDVTYNATLSACEKSKQWRASAELLEQMAFSGIRIDVISMDAAVTSCDLSVPLWRRALSYLRRFGHDARLQPSSITLNAALSVCRQRWPVVLALLDDVGRQVPKDSCTLPLLLGACESHVTWRASLEFLTEPEDRGRQTLSGEDTRGSHVDLAAHALGTSTAEDTTDRRPELPMGDHILGWALLVFLLWIVCWTGMSEGRGSHPHASAPSSLCQDGDPLLRLGAGQAEAELTSPLRQEPRLLSGGGLVDLEGNQLHPGSIRSFPEELTEKGETKARYVFRPLDHFLFTKDRYTSRFSALSPLAAYFSAARTALNGHAWYPYPVCPAWTVGPYCSKCPGNAAFWCVECNARFCPACAARFHHPGLYTEHHSLEPIKKEKQPRLAALLMSNFLASQQYAMIPIQPWEVHSFRSSTDMCPVMSTARVLATRVDSKLFYYYKADLAKYCNMEDSFYKFFLDGWVRGVVTASDDTLLVLTSAGPAYIMTTVLSIFLVPVVAACYGALMGVAHAIDSHLPQSQGLADAEEWLQRRKGSDGGGEVSEQTTPPPQCCMASGSEPPSDFYDKMKYNKNRRCPFDLAYLLRVLCSFLGFGKTIEEHQTWFSTPVAGMLFSDAFSVSLLRNLNAATSAILALLPFADGVSNAIIFLFLSVLAVIVGFLIFLYLITEQQREYYSKWTDESVQQKTVGCCARESCKCESIQFFTEKAVQE
ncbi:unnamed protein product [Durusdinium trenchii]|uniref:B box-type domain-containing protein n=1 Tax=Durusdinium trenchii TaxID=1381693 RepID=A0ABP0N1K1_9DINO